MDYVDNGPCLGDILARVLEEKTGMRVDVQLREPAGEPSYEWRVVGLFERVVFRSEYRTETIDWLYDHADWDVNYILKRVPVDTRGKLTNAARVAMDLIVHRYPADCYGVPQKINCIKAVRGIFNLGLREAKDLVEDYLNDL